MIDTYYVNDSHNRTLWDIIYNEIPSIEHINGAYSVSKEIENIIHYGPNGKLNLKYKIESVDTGGYKVSIFSGNRVYDINCTLYPVEREVNTNSKIVEKYTNLDIKDYLERYGQIKGNLPDEFYRFTKSYIYNKYDTSNEIIIGESITYCGITIEIVDFSLVTDEFIFKITFPTDESLYLKTVFNDDCACKSFDNIVDIDVLYRGDNLFNTFKNVKGNKILYNNLKFMIKYMISGISEHINYKSNIKLNNDANISMYAYVDKKDDDYKADIGIGMKCGDDIDLFLPYHSVDIIIQSYKQYELDYEYTTKIHAGSDIMNKLILDGWVPDDTKTIRIKFDTIYVPQ